MLIFQQYLEIGGRPDSSQGSNYRTTSRFFHNKFKPVEDPTALKAETTELQADFSTISSNLWKTRQLLAVKLQNYRLIFEQYLQFSGRPDSSEASNYRTTGKFLNTMLKLGEDPTALRCQTTELQADF